MDSKEFTRRARRYAKKTSQAFDFEPGKGKGSHGRLWIGERFTTLPRGEIKTGLFNGLLKQLGITKEDF